MPDNPFANAFSPDRGGLTGFIGGLAGVPTQEQSAGGATAQAMSDLSALKDQGMTNQQALLKFFQTPAGHDYFTSAGPNGMKALADGLTATTNAPPTMNNIPPGGMLTATDPQSGQTRTAANNPQQFPNQVVGPQDTQVDGKGNPLFTNTNSKGDTPAKVKEFQYFSQIAKLPAAEIQRLAGINADPSLADKSTATTQAVDELVKNYGLDAQTGEKIKAGVLHIIPQKDSFGVDTGAVTIVDLSTGKPTATTLNPGQQAPAGTAPSVPNPVSGTSPSTGAATGVLPPAATPTDDTQGPKPPLKAGDIAKNNPAYFGSKADMFLSSGVVPSIMSGVSSATEQLNPSSVVPSGAKSADRQNQIDTLRSDLAAMGQLGGGIGVNKGVLDGYMKLAPTGSATESPHQAVQKAIRLSEHIDSEIAEDSKIISSNGTSNEDKKAASARIQGWHRVQNDLPQPEELQRMEAAIRGGTAGALTIGGSAKEIAQAGASALTEAQKQVGQASTAVSPKGQQNFDAMSPEEIVKVDPQSLDRSGLIAYRRRIQAIKGTMNNGRK